MKNITPQAETAEQSAEQPEAFARNRYLKYELTERSIILNAPEKPGVYGLYNVVWIYIGATENIRSRLLEHLADDHRYMKYYRPSGFAFEVVPVQEERSRRLRELLNELEPLCETNAAGVIERKGNCKTRRPRRPDPAPPFQSGAPEAKTNAQR
jgi:hypothetical protein